MNPEQEVGKLGIGCQTVLHWDRRGRVIIRIEIEEGRSEIKPKADREQMANQKKKNKKTKKTQTKQLRVLGPLKSAINETQANTDEEEEEDEQLERQEQINQRNETDVSRELEQINEEINKAKSEIGILEETLKSKKKPKIIKVEILDESKKYITKPTVMQNEAEPVKEVAKTDEEEEVKIVYEQIGIVEPGENTHEILMDENNNDTPIRWKLHKIDEDKEDIGRRFRKEWTYSYGKVEEWRTSDYQVEPEKREWKDERKREEQKRRTQGEGDYIIQFTKKMLRDNNPLKLNFFM